MRELAFALHPIAPIGGVMNKAESVTLLKLARTNKFLTLQNIKEISWKYLPRF